MLDYSINSWVIMLLKKLQKTVLLCLSTFFISACNPVVVVGGKCEYDTFKRYAIVKEIKKEYVLLEIDGYLMKDRHLTDVHIGEVLPLDMSIIKKGSCSPSYYEINKNDYLLKKE